MPLVSLRQPPDHAAESDYGLPAFNVIEEIVTGIKHDVHKVNIDTDIRLAMTGAIRRHFVENPAKFDPREYLKPAREVAKPAVSNRSAWRRWPNAIRAAT